MNAHPETVDDGTAIPPPSHRGDGSRREQEPAPAAPPREGTDYLILSRELGDEGGMPWAEQEWVTATSTEAAIRKFVSTYMPSYVKGEEFWAVARSSYRPVTVRVEAQPRLKIEST